MRRQTYLVRKEGRYHFRRRLPWAFGPLGSITLSLNTAEPAEARRLARRLAARWDETTMFMGHAFERQTLTIDERRQLMRKALEQELALATAPAPRMPAHPSTHKILAAAYEVIQRVSPDAECLSQSDLNTIVDETWSKSELDLLRTTLTLLILPSTVDRAMAAAALREIDAPVQEGTLDEARCAILSGRIEAQRRAELFTHPLLTATGDAAYYLLDDALVAQARRSLIRYPPTEEPASSPSFCGIFAKKTSVRFSEQIDALEQAMFDLNEWQPDNGKTRLILEVFAWLTGDKAMSDYRPCDITTYIQRQKKIPNDFGWGKLGKSGGMSLPFDPATFSKAPPVAKRRSNRTINSHLTKMAAASEVLKKSFWLAASGYELIMDFADERLKVDDDPADPKRVPWTPEHLRVLYSLPLWQGGGGANARLKFTTSPIIYQDAAYWVPLIVTYTGLAREEASGLEGADFNFDCEVPYLMVQANMTRSKDGQTKSGLKRKSRYRAMPLHPELLRLGLEDYVAANPLRST